MPKVYYSLTGVKIRLRKLLAKKERLAKQQRLKYSSRNTLEPWEDSDLIFLKEIIAKHET